MSNSITPNVLGQVEGDGAPQDFRNEISSFLNFLNDTDTSIPIGSNFVIRFDQFPTAVKNNNISIFEPAWNVGATTKLLLNIANNQKMASTDSTGIVPPVESVDVSRYGMASDFAEHSGGLLSGVVSKSRVQQEPLSIAFIETNRSFVDFVIRPWAVLVSHYGLIARKEPNFLKSTITAVFFDTTTHGEGSDAVVRKFYRFQDCAPVAIASGTSYDYGTTSLNVYKTSWVYSKYDIFDFNPGSK